MLQKSSESPLGKAEDYFRAKLKFEFHISTKPGMIFLLSKGEKAFDKRLKQWKKESDELWSAVVAEAKKLGVDINAETE